MFATSRPGAGVPGEPFTFDPTVLAAAAITGGQRPEQPDLLSPAAARTRATTMSRWRIC